MVWDHAVYTLSDPRAVILKKYAYDLAEKKGFGPEFRLLEAVERLTPDVFAEIKGKDKAMCANVDLYSGMVYRSLGISKDLYTPLFAVARDGGLERPSRRGDFDRGTDYPPGL